MRLHPRLCLLPLFTLTLLAQDRQPGRSVNFYSKEKEAALGAALARQVQQTTVPLNNPAALVLFRIWELDSRPGYPSPASPIPSR